MCAQVLSVQSQSPFSIRHVQSVAKGLEESAQYPTKCSHSLSLFGGRICLGLSSFGIAYFQLKWNHKGSKNVAPTGNIFGGIKLLERKSDNGDSAK